MPTKLTVHDRAPATAARTPVVLRWPDLPDTARAAWEPAPPLSTAPIHPPRPDTAPHHEPGTRHQDATPHATPHDEPRGTPHRQVVEHVTRTGPWPRLDDEPGHGHTAVPWEQAGPQELWPPEGRRTPGATTREPVPDGAGGRWPQLPDDTPQWRVTPRRGHDDRIRRLDEEQRGLPWNA